MRVFLFVALFLCLAVAVLGGGKRFPTFSRTSPLPSITLAPKYERLPEETLPTKFLPDVVNTKYTDQVLPPHPSTPSAESAFPVRSSLSPLPFSSPRPCALCCLTGHHPAQGSNTAGGAESTPQAGRGITAGSLHSLSPFCLRRPSSRPSCSSAWCTSQ